VVRRHDADRRLARLRLQLAAQRVDDELASVARAPVLAVAALAGLVVGLLPGETLAGLGRGLLTGLATGVGAKASPRRAAGRAA